MNLFEEYSKRALSPAQPRLIGAIKTRAEAKAAYVRLVGEMCACRDLVALNDILETSNPIIVQFHAELEFLWFGDGEDFLGLEREIERAFETVEAATFFTKFRSDPKCEAGHLFGQSVNSNRT